MVPRCPPLLYGHEKWSREGEGLAEQWTEVGFQILLAQWGPISPPNHSQGGLAAEGLSTCPSSQGHHGGHSCLPRGPQKTHHSTATCTYHGLRPLARQPQALTVVVKGTYHGGHSGSHGDLPQRPQGRGKGGCNTSSGPS